MHRLKAALLNGTLLVAATVVALGLGELTVRIFAPQQLIVKRPDIWEPLDTLGWGHRPNVSTRINTGERTVNLYTDSLGDRVGRAGPVRSPHRILLVGDSYMEALQVEYRQSLAGLLEQRLPRALGYPVEVRNTGVGAWNPPQYLVKERRALSNGHYDLVLVSLYLGNDIVPRLVRAYPRRPPVEVHRFHFPHSFSGHEFIQDVLYPINDFLEVRSQLFIFLKTRLQNVLARLGLSAAYLPRYFLRSHAHSGSWAVTAGICRDMEQEAKRHGTPFLLFMVPTSFEVDTAGFGEFVRSLHIKDDSVDVNQPDRLMRQALDSAGVNYMDLTDPLREVFDSTHQSLYGKIDRHWSPAGHLAAARLLEPRIVAILRHSVTQAR